MKIPLKHPPDNLRLVWINHKRSIKCYFIAITPSDRILRSTILEPFSHSRFDKFASIIIHNVSPFKIKKAAAFLLRQKNSNMKLRD